MRWLNWVSDRRLRLYWSLIFVAALGAFGLRAPRLSMRPMHTDEAVHADKFRMLLEDGVYEYDPHEYHGPTLNYFTLIPARLSGANKYTEITEVTLRIVPVVFGTLLVLLIAGLARGLGFAAVVAAVLAALSPAMVFYSRYYIQEMLLACFTLGVIVCGYRYVRTRSLLWAIAAGGFAGTDARHEGNGRHRIRIDGTGPGAGDARRSRRGPIRAADSGRDQPAPYVARRRGGGASFRRCCSRCF